jgi:hypothetical protein
MNEVTDLAQSGHHQRAELTPLANLLLAVVGYAGDLLTERQPSTPDRIPLHSGSR